MTLKEAATLLGVTPDTLRQRIAAGTFRARKIGRDWSVSRREVERYRQERRKSHTPMPSQTWADAGLLNICECAVRVIRDGDGWKHDAKDL